MFMIGNGNKRWVTQSRGKGMKLAIAEERDKRLLAEEQAINGSFASCTFYSKQPILGLMQEGLLFQSYPSLEYGVHDRLHIYHLCGIFDFPWLTHQIKGTNGLQCLIRKTGNVG